MTRNPKSQPNRGKSLLATLRQARPEATEAAPQPETGDITLSLAQQTLLASQELHGDQAVGNITHCWDLRGNLDAPALERALARLVERHDALRMGIAREGGRPVARFSPRLDTPLPCETPPDPDPASRLQWVEAQIETESLTSLPSEASLHGTPGRLKRALHRLRRRYSRRGSFQPSCPSDSGRPCLSGGGAPRVRVVTFALAYPIWARSPKAESTTNCIPPCTGPFAKRA